MSTATPIIDRAFLFFTLFGLLTLGAIVVVTAIFIFRYSRKRHPVPVDVKGNVWLEIAWLVVPTIIALGMFRIGLTGYWFSRNPPEGAMTVQVTAFQFGWEFDYENGKKTGELVVPVDRPVTLQLTSRDVIHDFYVPAFRIKQDAVPGTTTTMWFNAVETGEYDALCAEYCGVGHSDMLTKVVVVPQAEFDAWYASDATAPPAVSSR
jgi:cytochrome c oxidase subunit 2